MQANKRKFISLQQAADDLGKTLDGTRSWVRRHNERHPEAPVITLPKLVDAESLQAALEAEVERRNARAIRRRNAVRDLAAGEGSSGG